MYYEFTGIESAATSIAGASKGMVAAWDGVKSSSARLAGNWQGTGSMSWQDSQVQLDAMQNEVMSALADLGVRLEQTGITMQGTDSAVRARFGH
ncbi:WXG100 family type VII secretion target [Nocardia altamirensis]|uniref:WXG100 family type VII secretion target n=1 Tax=Nocardia altamirensis TaxID=472158 RepID=UPI0008406F7F|nr:WXG100 family type VII secretion target [Nocardia altamirensis]